MINRLLTKLLALGILASASCSPAKEPQTKAAAPNAKPSRIFQVRGVVKEIPKTGNQLRIAHEAISNYMPAMTMPFSVKDRTELAEIQVGDIVSFALHVAETESWIDQIQTIQNSPDPEQPPPAFRPAREVQPLQIGDSLPNHPFINQENQAVRLGDFKGNVLVFTFIFTRCPLPEFCPRMSQRFKAACESLQNDPQAPDNFRFLSISFDPVFDTPKILKNYAQTFSANLEKWSFLTGKIADIDDIAGQFGLHFIRSQQLIDSWDHNLRTVLVDPQGIIRQIYIGNAWTSETLIADIKAAAQKTKTQEPDDTNL